MVECEGAAHLHATSSIGIKDSLEVLCSPDRLYNKRRIVYSGLI